MIALFGLCTLGVGLSPNFTIAILFLAGVGASDMISTVQRQTIRQLAVPDEMRGRLSSIGMIFQISGPQLGDWEAAQLAGYAGTRTSFAIGGLGAMIAAFWYDRRGPALRDYRYGDRADGTTPSTVEGLVPVQGPEHGPDQEPEIERDPDHAPQTRN